MTDKCSCRRAFWTQLELLFKLTLVGREVISTRLPNEDHRQAVFSLVIPGHLYEVVIIMTAVTADLFSHSPSGEQTAEM